MTAGAGGGVAIEVDHVSKRFRRYLVRNQSVKSAVFKRSRRSPRCSALTTSPTSVTIPVNMSAA